MANIEEILKDHVLLPGDVSCVRIAPLSPGKYVLAYHISGSTALNLRILNITGTSVSLGDIQSESLTISSYSGDENHISLVIINESRFVVFRQNGQYVYYDHYEVNDDVLSRLYTAQVGGYSSRIYAAKLTDTKVAVVYWGVSNYGTIKVGEISGNTITFGTAVNFFEENSVGNPTVCKIDDTRALIAYQDSGHTPTPEHPYKYLVATISGTDITLNTQYTFNSDEAMGRGNALINDSGIGLVMNGDTVPATDVIQAKGIKINPDNTISEGTILDIEAGYLYNTNPKIAVLGSRFIAAYSNLTDNAYYYFTSVNDVTLSLSEITPVSLAAGVETLDLAVNDSQILFAYNDSVANELKITVLEEEKPMVKTGIKGVADIKKYKYRFYLAPGSKANFEAIKAEIDISNIFGDTDFAAYLDPDDVTKSFHFVEYGACKKGSVKIWTESGDIAETECDGNKEQDKKLKAEAEVINLNITAEKELEDWNGQECLVLIYDEEKKKGRIVYINPLINITTGGGASDSAKVTAEKAVDSRSEAEVVFLVGAKS